MIGDKKYPWIRRTFGTSHHKDLVSVSIGYTETRKKVAAASDNAVHAGITTSASAQSVTTGITNPDVPRALRLAFGGTTGDFAASTVVVHGTNVEGKPIYEEFAVSANQTADIEGNKAFKTVTQIDVPIQDGTAGTLTVGYNNKIGVHHRLYTSNTTAKVFTSTSVASRIPPTLQSTAPTIAANENSVELNTVTPATTPDGTTFLTIAYIYDYWNTGSDNDNPDYNDATTTSTSTTTATTTTTTSTSTSTSSTSTSTSSTSTSTSSTSTSTTTIA